MSLPDLLVGQYGALATDLGADEVKELAGVATQGGPEAGKAKRSVARSIVGLYHGEETATAAEAAFDRQFKQHQAPEVVPEKLIPIDAVDKDRVYLPRVLVEVEFASSRSEARRLIEGGGVRINGEVVSVDDVPLVDLSGAVLQVGKRRFVRLTTGEASGPMAKVVTDLKRGKRPKPEA
jgi:tyrosyl-tRNA synthetase